MASIHITPEGAGTNFGTQAKALRARSRRRQIRAEHEFSSAKSYNSGFRYLTDRELDEWYARLDRVLGKRVRIPK